MNFQDLPFQWNELIFNLGPLTAELRLLDLESALEFRCLIGIVSDTYGVDEIYEQMPVPGFNLEYELQPQSKVHASSFLPLGESTSRDQIYTFIRNCSMLSIVGVQSLVHLRNLIIPIPAEIEKYQLGPGQRYWGNPSIASEFLRN